jgi:hypothetical protein
MPIPVSSIMKVRRLRPLPAGLAPTVRLTLLGELDRVVDEVLDRGAQPHRIADRNRRQVVRNLDDGDESFRLGARAQGRGHRLGEIARAECVLPQHQLAGVGPDPVDHHGRQLGEMLGRALHRRGPGALAFRQVRGCEQLTERQNAVERRANLVRETGKRHIQSARPLARASGAHNLLLPPAAFGRRYRVLTPTHSSIPAPQWHGACHPATADTVSGTISRQER